MEDRDCGCSDESLRIAVEAHGREGEGATEGEEGDETFHKIMYHFAIASRLAFLVHEPFAVPHSGLL